MTMQCTNPEPHTAHTLDLVIDGVLQVDDYLGRPYKHHCPGVPGVKIEFTGTTYWMRSAGPHANQCICCEGPHVFAYGAALDDRDGETVRDVIERAYRTLPEGARFKITIEEVLGDQCYACCGGVILPGDGRFGHVCSGKEPKP